MLAAEKSQKEDLLREHPAKLYALDVLAITTKRTSAEGC